MPTVWEALTIETYRRFHAAVNSGDLEVIETAIEEVIHPDARFHTAEPSGLTAIAMQKRIWATLLRAFPDLHVTVDDLLCADDKIVARQTVTGTNTGEYRGMPPTGRPVRYSEIFIFRFADGQIVDLWGVVDVLSQLRQLGHVT
ncbi:ester cyclase [Actinoplanes awajinensis]|uniref:Ester cyclase n=1 Tax=Actinoplanes awajinensis subsp. mycoplanecinus TaxID=135947 RepID=A0A0X3VCB7_9ACTN|nr:ester cyclase [Actinoplanes awajinensis]KUL42067.1 ester cyclase [Actinoplanes awajinensis subsp. mycoplanecinus]